jgi:hypothetical protein
MLTRTTLSEWTIRELECVGLHCAVREDESAVGHAVANVRGGRVKRPRSINQRGDSGSTPLHHSSIGIGTAVIIWTIAFPKVSPEQSNTPAARRKQETGAAVARWFYQMPANTTSPLRSKVRTERSVNCVSKPKT